MSGQHYLEGGDQKNVWWAGRCPGSWHRGQEGGRQLSAEGGGSEGTAFWKEGKSVLCILSRRCWWVIRMAFGCLGTREMGKASIVPKSVIDDGDGPGQVSSLRRVRYEAESQEVPAFYVKNDRILVIS